MFSEMLDTDNGMASVTKKKVRILVVVRHPLGGIRSYMKYMYSHMPEHYSFSILAPHNHEHDALAKDVARFRGELLPFDTDGNVASFFYGMVKCLSQAHFDLIHSHGYISGAIAFGVNQFFRLPHVLTVHGLLEERQLQGIKGMVKEKFLGVVLRNVDVLNPVGEDLHTHLLTRLPNLKQTKNRLLMIPNGIDISCFTTDRTPNTLRTDLGVDNNTFLFGYFGRFMPEKGFGLLIDAIDQLRNSSFTQKLKVLAVGTGDYLAQYIKEINLRNLQDYFLFMPFQSDMPMVYEAVDAVIMPSRWEALPLQPMEALCCGKPFIASDCIGLREVVYGTPTLMFETNNVLSLASSIGQMIENPRRQDFLNYAKSAQIRFDVKRSSDTLAQIFEGLISSKSNDLNIPK